MTMKVLNNQKMQNNDIIENIQKRGYSTEQTNRRIINNLNNYYINQWTEEIQSNIKIKNIQMVN